MVGKGKANLRPSQDPDQGGAPSRGKDCGFYSKQKTGINTISEGSLWLCGEGTLGG